MATINFPPTLASQQDSKYYSMVREDQSVKTEMEGGYETTRPRTTRTARRKFTTGLTDISQADYDVWEAFVAQVNTFLDFNWTDPTTSESIEVRFEKPPMAKYQGYGGNGRYNIPSITIKEV